MQSNRYSLLNASSIQFWRVPSQQKALANMDRHVLHETFCLVMGILCVYGGHVGEILLLFSFSQRRRYIASQCVRVCACAVVLFACASVPRVFACLCASTSLRQWHYPRILLLGVAVKWRAIESHSLSIVLGCDRKMCIRQMNNKMRMRCALWRNYGF